MTETELLAKLSKLEAAQAELDAKVADVKKRAEVRDRKLNFIKKSLMSLQEARLRLLDELLEEVRNIPMALSLLLKINTVFETKRQAILTDKKGVNKIFGILGSPKEPMSYKKMRDKALTEHAKDQVSDDTLDETND